MTTREILPMKIVITFLILTCSLSIFGASKGANSPMVIGIIKEVHSDNIVVVTRDKFTRKLLLNDKSKIIYVGFDGAKKEIKKSFCIRASVKNEVIGSIYVTPGIGEDPVYPTPEMVKMTPKELFQVADLNQNGNVCYVEASKTIKHSLKHGPVSFSKTDRDRSGGLNLKEFSAFLGKVKWWNMSRKTPEQWFKGSDKDSNEVLSKEELADLLGSNAHIDVFFKRADKNSSGDLDQKEVSAFINELIFS